MNNEMNRLTMLYEVYLNEFKESGYHPHPANLLALLLLPEKDTFEPLKVSEGNFYQIYKDKIDDKINQVVHDFQISVQEIKAFIEANGVSSDSFEHDKIWFVFHKGFGIMHGEMMYRPNQTDYDIYHLMGHKTDLYKMTALGLEEYQVEKKLVLKRRIKI